MKTLSVAFRVLLPVLVLVPVLGLGGASACGKTPATAGGAGSVPDTLTLTKVGNLKVQVPSGGASVQDGVAGGNMVIGPGIVVAVDYASETRPKTIDDAKKEAADYSPQNLKAEALSDGWLLAFDNAGTAGKNFFVQVRRDIAGKSIWCETTASQPEQADNAVKACKSLKP